jgi:chromosome segregation protein
VGVIVFLKSLEIFGFKSFADRIKIDFSDGITALLGPNGCGKSNVVDAIKWVLGERSPKNMRAEKMEDVIFGGTESRKALNVAEVTLLLNNENKILPVDVNEVAIKRRFYRSGENEYYFNNVQVRLKEIQELFWDTGVGKIAYSVMEQGKIDQILSSKPEDRRYLFEEAAEITRFKMKRVEAEKRLAKTEDDMRQNEIIQAELKRSYDSLKTQAQKTTLYRKYRDETFYLELDVQLLKLKGFVSDQARYEKDLIEGQAARDAVRAEIDEINKTLSENMDAVNEMESSLVSLQREIYALHATKLEKEKQAKQWADRRIELKAKIAQLQAREETLAEKIDALKNDIDEQGALLFEKRKRLSDTEKNIAEFQQNIALASRQITDNDAQSERHEKTITHLVQKRKEMQRDLILITEDIVTELDSRLKDAGYSSSVCAAAKERVFEVLAKLCTLASGRKALFNDFASVTSPSAADSKDWTQKAVLAFGEILDLSRELEQAVKAYTDSTPAFINEFLAPEGIITKKRSIDRAIQENEEEEKRLRGEIEQLKAHNAGLSGKINEYRITLEDLKMSKVQMQAQMEGAEDNIRILKRELAAQENSLKETRDECGSEQTRLKEAEETLNETESELAEIERNGASMTEQLEKLEKNILQKNNDVSGKRARLLKKSEEAQDKQARIEQISLKLNTIEIEIRNVKETFMEIHSRDLMEFEERMYTIVAAATALREQLAAKRQAVKELGNVNLMAPEEFAEVKTRYEFRAKQIEDLKTAKENLTRIAEEIRAESSELFLDTYSKIKKNFHNMFRRLFDGGRAELRLLDPKNVLESGIEIYAQPPGKKLENIALLSGGEKTMTAVALLFATYRVHPSPFCLLDEIDAALDEKNIGFFVNTLREFSHVSQYIVISHNKKTAAGAGTLLGITMEESGVSKLFSIRVDEREKPVLFESVEFEEEEVAAEEDVVIPPHPPKRVKALVNVAENQSGEDEASAE